MKLEKINPFEFDSKIFDLWNNQWMLVTSGDFENSDFNTMTVAWGSFGVMWNKPFVQIVVRPQRHTFEFTEKYDSFTLTAFPEQYKDALKLLGKKSGRDGDKIAEAGLTPVQSEIVTSPGFEEAELIVECKKIYRDKFSPENFLLPEIDKNYPQKDYHIIYYGEVVNIKAVSKFKRETPGVK
ncbi:MAG: flavin reductase family protein [Rhodothermaceae bacterium]